MVNYKILHPQPEDAKDLVDYLNEIGGETTYISFGKGEFHYSVEEEKKFISDLKKNKNGVMLVAKDEDNNIIAEGTCISNSRRHAHVFTIALTVKKKYWSNGIGTALTKKMEEESKKIGCKKIILHVYSHNEAAIGLYKKLEYKIEGVLKMDAKIDNEYVDTIIKAKFL